MPPIASSTLELDSNEHLQLVRREWKVERVGWMLVMAFVLAGLAGLLGPGPVSRRTLTSNDQRLRVEYYAVAHYQAPAELRIRCVPAAQEQIRLSFSRSFTDVSRPLGITPEPSSVVIHNDRLVYSFESALLQGDA